MLGLLIGLLLPVNRYSIGNKLKSFSSRQEVVRNVIGPSDDELLK